MANPMDIAQTLLGKGETPDRGAIQEYLRNGGVNLDPVTTAWCAAYVNSTLKQAGIEGTGSNLARSFMNFGEEVKTPQRGDIAVFSRGDPNGPYGHVGFFDSYAPDGRIRVLGGNQGDAVSIADYGADRLLGFRRAAAAAAPQAPGTPAPPMGPGQVVADRPVAEPQMASAGPTAPEQSGFGKVMASITPEAMKIPQPQIDPGQLMLGDGGAGVQQGAANAAMGAERAKGLATGLAPNIDMLMGLGKRPTGPIKVG